MSVKIVIVFLSMRKHYLAIYIILCFFILALPLIVVNAQNNDNFELVEPGILPNSFWYNFEIIKERVIIIFTFSNLSKANKLLSLSTERLSELKKMAETNDTANSKKVIERYNQTLDEMKSKLDDCNKEADKTKEQIILTQKTTSWQREKLTEIKQTAPKELENDIDNAIKKADEISKLECN